MKAFLLFTILLITVFQGQAQNNAPEVTNVTFSQRSDSSFTLDVYYDLNDPDGDTMFVTMQVSEDSGATWTFACDSISGDVGVDILSDTSKHIVWDFGVEHPQTFGDAFRIRIIADDQVLTIGTVIDIDGNVYQTVKIGLQWWMAENLKVTHYRSSEAIPHVTNNGQWMNLTSGAYCNYDNDTTHVATYGRLYNWYAVEDNRNIAPQGWHVPSDDEWKELEMYLGMSQSQANGTGGRGTDEGSKLKSTSGWNNNGNGTNESGFSALPGGCRNMNGLFYNIGYLGFWWSTPEYSASDALQRILLYNSSQVVRDDYSKKGGSSIRCVRD